MGLAQFFYILNGKVSQFSHLTYGEGLAFSNPIESIHLFRHITLQINRLKLPIEYSGYTNTENFIIK
ncbi:hypothetical protein FTHG_00388 [Francisella tularensis subsp. holarctica 257]|nr:hypothetical protein FTHG_00388 [Francisella tularensis subsp. holarctica 257]